MNLKEKCENCELFYPKVNFAKVYADNKIVGIVCEKMEVCNLLEEKFAKKSSPIIEEDDSLKGKATDI